MTQRAWLFVLILTLFAAVPVHAQVTPAEKAAAEALFDRGIVALREGKLEEACARLEQSNAIERGIGTMLYLAECYEKSGRTASAWALFREAASEAQAGGQLERATAGRQRAERLEPQLARLTIDVPPEHRVHGLEVRRNGTLVPQGAWGIALPVDPGEHVIEARATGFAAKQQQVMVEKGPSMQRFDVPRLEAAPVAAISAPEVDATLDASPQKGGTLTAPAAPPAPPRGLTKLQIAGITMGGAGVVLLAVGTGYGIRAIKKNDAAKEAGCNAKTCWNERAQGLSDDAWRASRVSNFGVIGGAALLAGGLLTYFLAPKPDTQVAVSLDRRAVSLGLGGVF